MSNNFRPSVGGRPPMTGRMMTHGNPTGPGGLPVHPSAYGMIAGQPQQFYTPYTHPVHGGVTAIPNRMPTVNAVPGPIPGMYVPVKSGVSPRNVDPTKLLEEQKRLEKERNFQMQQQRLKQFTVAGKKGSLNAENMIDSMFGKLPPKIPNAVPSPVARNINIEPSAPFIPIKPNFESSHSAFSQPCLLNQEIPQNVPTKTNKVDKKELDVMMQECSDLKAGHQKASTFTKPVVRELAPTVQQRSTFTASNKARDWKNLQGFDEVFVADKPRYPNWLKKENIPEQYRQIEAFVTNNGANEPDTKLLFPILVSSGLPQPTLSHIWELVNQSTPGCLTREEMYAALALIAIAQAGHPIQSMDILHQLPSCPVPHLQCFSPTGATQPQDNSSQQTSSNETTQPDLVDSRQVLRPSAISLAPASGSVTSETGGFPDDDFDDFKSATPTAVNFPLNSPSPSSTQEDNFADFKQAPMVTPNTSSTTAVNHQTTSLPEVKCPLPISSMNRPVGGLFANKLLPSDGKNNEIDDLMSPDEDKYSAFRSLQETEEWGAFSSIAPKNTDVEDSSQSNTPTFPSKFLNNPEVKSTEAEEESEDFGDFLQANIPAKVVNITTSFADFANFKEPEFPSSQTADDDFGDFASSFPVSGKPEPGHDFKSELSHDFKSELGHSINFDLGHEFSNKSELGQEFSFFKSELGHEFSNKLELGHEFHFQNVRDNISLAESQSVSSLELGAFDGGGHSGESKSSLSRQGSIPSLDLKNSVADNDEFGEFQSQPGLQSSKTPSPSKELKMNGSNNTTINTPNLAFQNTRNASLIDKYSVIRSEQQREEDQHISCWIRCLQSSVNILQNTKKIFNQMSCSTVCNEVLNSEEGENYIKDVIEVYKVIRRIAASSKAVGKQTIAMLDLLKDANQTWNTICGFFAGSNLMPEETTLQFSNDVLTSNSDNIEQACGLCLLNLDLKTKSRKEEENLKLSYGGRSYHSTCANLWVNCVDRLLPALTLPQLL